MLDRVACRGIAALLSAALLALAASCAPAPAPPGPNPPAVGSNATGAETRAAGPSEWVVAVAEEAATLDPGSGTSASGSSVAQLHIFDALLAYEGEHLQAVPRLAESWTLLDDQTWDFRLRRGVKFHNGDDFTAADVKYSFDVFKGERSPRQTYVHDVVGVEVLDPYTIRLRTAAPNPGLLANLSLLAILPHQAREQAGEAAFGEHPIGTGPYRYVDFARGQRLVLEANPTYWRGQVVPARLTLRTITDPATRVAELKAGGVQLIAAPPLAQLAETQGGDTELIPLRGARIVMLPFNTTVPPFDDARVRQAVNYAVDRQAIVQSVLEGYGELLHGPYGSAWLGYDQTLAPYPYDPPKARQLLAEAGYPNGLETTFNVSNGALLKDRELGEVVASQLGQVGIKVQVVPTERAKIQDDWRNGTFRGITMVAWGTAADPDLMINWGFYQRKGHRPDDRLNALVEQSRRTVDPDQRKQVLQQLGRYANDQAYWLFIHAQDEFYARRKDVPWPFASAGNSYVQVQYYRLPSP